MKLFSLSVFFFIFIFCNSYLANSSSAENSKKIVFAVDLEKEKQLQLEVDRGHQPWRLEPVDVAYAQLATIDKSIMYDRCQLISETNLEAVVSCKTTKRYVVHLKRLVRPKGIWTATNIQVE